MFFSSRGKLLAANQSLDQVKIDPSKLSPHVDQYYAVTSRCPRNHHACHLPDEGVIAEWLSEKKNKKMILTVPSIGAKNALLQLANDNARNLWESTYKKREEKEFALQILQEKLSLAGLPRRIECYDISNIGGTYAVGSMAVLRDGDPDKNSYRRYRVTAPAEPDDYKMMQEVLSRRFSSGEHLPDLVVVDGGKGQLNVALSVLKDLKIRTDVIGLAK